MCPRLAVPTVLFQASNRRLLAKPPSHYRLVMTRLRCTMVLVRISTKILPTVLDCRTRMYSTIVRRMGRTRMMDLVSKRIVVQHFFVHLRSVVSGDMIPSRSNPILARKCGNQSPVGLLMPFLAFNWYPDQYQSPHLQLVACNRLPSFLIHTMNTKMFRISVLHSPYRRIMRA